MQSCRVSILNECMIYVVMEIIHRVSDGMCLLDNGVKVSGAPSHIDPGSMIRVNTIERTYAGKAVAESTSN